MPIINSSYQPPFYLRNGHIATILPSMFRKVDGVNYARERITTPDDDFLDIDWIKKDNKRLVLVLHGLEGNIQRHYVKGVAKHFSVSNWDVAAWNARSCSGEMNTQPRLYHHGDVEDVVTTIEYIIKNNNYKEIALVGFSMGGAMVLNYISDYSIKLPALISKAVVISPPVEVGDSAVQLEKASMSFYRKRFLDKLKKKMKQKAIMHPSIVKVDGIDAITTFAEFDRRYTAPLHNFETTEAFYKNASSKHQLSNINIPTLLLIAKDDPFMPPSCYPLKEAKNHPNLYLELTEGGGHVGFPIKNHQHSWMEIRALAFIEK
ncbi:MAG: alpha/beta fold hydrolase [Cyclobacteriaceae bacterium]|nr:alpha/beta fold hydrolase [Cyclobacteriaceae bacterium]